MIKFQRLNILFRSFFWILIVCITIQLTERIDFLHTETAFVVFFLFLLICGPSYRTMKVYRFIQTSLLFLFATVITVYKLIGVSNISWSYLSVYYGWIFYSLIGIFIGDSLSRRQKMFLLYSIYAAVMANILYLFIYGTKYLRIRGMHVEFLANASYSSMLMIFCGICFVWFLHDKRRFNRLFSAIGFGLAIYVNIVILQRGINFVLTTIMILFLLLFNTRRKTSTIVLVVILAILILFLYLSGVYVSLFHFLIERLDYRLAKKMSQILIFLETGSMDEAGGFSGRFYLLQTSFKTWTSSLPNFLLGAGDTRGANDLVGNHHEIFDNFTRYGLLFGPTVFLILTLQIRDVVLCVQGSKHTALKKQTATVMLINLARNLIGTTVTGAMSIVIIIFFKQVLEKCQESQEEVPST